MRVASEAMGRKISSPILPSRLAGSCQPHQPLLRTSTVRTSASRVCRRKAPVPLVLRTVCISSRARVFCGRVALCRSDQLRDMMKIEAILFGRIGSGTRVMMSTTIGSGDTARSIVSTKIA